MLVLTRRVGEEIVIDGAIRVKVVAIEKHRVRLGIVAPKNVVVDREEVYRWKEGFQGADTKGQSDDRRTNQQASLASTDPASRGG